MLRFTTYLAPSIPLALYEVVVELVGAALEREVALTSLTARSGPIPDDNPFARGEADVGFVCAPSYLRLDRARREPSVELSGAAPVYDDPRNEGRPVYHAEVVVRRGTRAASLADLRGARFAFNDDCSLSGYFSVLETLAELGAGPPFFSRMIGSGSHLRSLEMITAGEADCAAIDAFALRVARAAGHPAAEAVATIETLGPFAVQPVVVRASLPEGDKRAVREALLQLHERNEGRLRAVGLCCFAAVDDGHYDRQRRLLSRL